ncbi:MAG: lipoprotein [Rhodanobacter sp.]
MRRSLLLLPFCFAVAALAGCGNKGPLVMPPPTPVPAVAPPVPIAPAPASSSAMPATHQP